MSSTHALTGSMQDGRFFTSFEPICSINAKVAADAGIESWNSTAYRKYLQKHGLQILNSTRGPCGSLQCSDHGMAISDVSTIPSAPYTEDPEM